MSYNGIEDQQPLAHSERPMRELTVVLDDEGLYTAIEAEAKTTGHTVQDVVIQALRQWRDDCELDAMERAELAEARREWKEEGGIEAHAFFDSLLKEETSLDR